METTSSGELTNFINTTVINLNIQVLINLFLYSAAATSGVLVASKIITSLFEEVLRFLRFRLELKHKDKMGEIHELNRKMHDRLVEIEESIESNEHPPDKTKRRLLYNTSRIAKYDETIADDVCRLLNNWTVALSIKEGGDLVPGEVSKAKTESLSLIKEIKSKVDRLFIKT